MEEIVEVSQTETQEAVAPVNPRYVGYPILGELCTRLRQDGIAYREKEKGSSGIPEIVIDSARTFVTPRKTFLLAVARVHDLHGDMKIESAQDFDGFVTAIRERITAVGTSVRSTTRPQVSQAPTTVQSQQTTQFEELRNVITQLQNEVAVLKSAVEEAVGSEENNFAPSIKKIITSNVNLAIAKSLDQIQKEN
jgi:hypothetical protein